MAPLQTKPGTRRLSEVARYLVLPSGIMSTGWPAVLTKAREVGLGVDPWQDGAGRCILAKRADGMYAASIGGVVLSIPRQVGKTYLIGLIVFCLCLLTPNLTVIWTAHQLKTAGETFRAMQEMARRKKIWPSILHIRLGSGDEAVEFRNGSRILFGARERGFGLGFSMVDILVIDEGQRVTERTMDDLVPTTNQAPNPLILMAGTPPRRTDAGEVFRSRREEALSGESDDLLYLEMSADLGEEDPYSWSRNHVDWGLVAQSNPSVPDRTPRAAILRMRKNLGLESFLLEGLGIWLETHTGRGIDMEMWARLLLADDDMFDAQVFALDVSPDRSVACIVVAGICGDRVAVQVTTDDDGLQDHRPGTGWLLARMRKLAEDSPDAQWVIVGRSQAVTFVPFLEDELEAEVVQITPADWPAACASLVDMVSTKRVAHAGDLDDAFEGAVLVNVGEEQFRWGRRKSTADITPVVAATLAAVTVFGEGVPSTGDVLAAFK